VRKAGFVLAGVVLTMMLAMVPALAEVKPEPAQSDEIKKNKVVMGTVNVTAKRYQTEELDTGSFTTVITLQDMEQQGGNNAYDILQRNGGLNFSASLPGGVTQGGMNGEIGIRGIKGGEQIMLNGIPIIEHTAGSYDLDQIPAAFLERIEVVKGANSTLYGSRAMTGVINMRTRRPGADAVGGQFMGGSHGYFQGDAWYRNKMVFAGVYYSQQDELEEAKKNYSARSPYNTDLFKPKKFTSLLSFQPWEPLVFNYMFTSTDTGYRANYYKSPTISYKVDEEVYHHYLSGTYEKDRLQATAFFNYNYMTLDYDYYGNPQKPGKENKKTSFTTGLDLQHSTIALGTTFLYGGTWSFEQQDETRQDVSGSSSKGYYIEQADLDHNRHLPSLFLQAEKTLLDRLILTLGIRGQGVLNNTEGSDDYFEPVPQFQAVYKVTDRNSIYGNVGRAFRVPTFNQLYSETATFVGSADLKPEYGWTYEVGWKFEYGRMSGTLAAFLMQYKDKIRYVLDTTDDKYYARNVDKYQTAGVEWSFAFRVHDYIKLTFGGYGADPWEEEDGERIQAGPKWQMAPGIYFDNGKLQLGLNATILLERDHGLDDYVNVHLTGAYRLTDWMKLKLRVDNLFDKDLAVHGNMTPGYSSPYEVLDPGMWIYAGVEIDFRLL
jgi:vitamin B12 transporter